MADNVLTGQTAIVTGSARGIGFEVARLLLSSDANVIINDLDEEACIAAHAELAQAVGERVAAVPGDVTLATTADGLVDQALDRFGGVDILVNNAGYIWNSSLLQGTDEQLQAMLDVHLHGPVRLLRRAGAVIREAAKAEQARDGVARSRRVVNVSSTSGVYGAALQFSYATAKAGVLGLTTSLAREWGRYNVTVNAVAPGVTDTRLTAAYTDEPSQTVIGGRSVPVGLSTEQLKAARTMTPLQRLGTAREAAGAIYLLCRPEASFISGQTVVVAGGLTT